MNNEFVPSLIGYRTTFKDKTMYKSSLQSRKSIRKVRNEAAISPFCLRRRHHRH